MKTWSIVLITIMIITIAGSMLITAISEALNFSFWGMAAIGITSAAIGAICLWLSFVPTDRRVNIFLIIMLVAISYVGHKWAFYSADDTVHLKDMKELLAMRDKPIYFTLDEYQYNMKGIGATRTELRSFKRRYQSSHPTGWKYYTVVPLYADSVTEEAKVWLTDNYNTKLGAGKVQFSLNREYVLNFELLTADINYYKNAAQNSLHKHKAENPLFIQALYTSYTPRSTWGMYFLISLVIGIIVMATIGEILGSKKKEKEA